MKRFIDYSQEHDEIPIWWGPAFMFGFAMLVIAVASVIAI